MDNKETIIEEPIYANIDKGIKDRATLYITKSKIIGSKIDSMKTLIEEALDYYIMNNPL